MVSQALSRLKVCGLLALLPCAWGLGRRPLLYVVVTPRLRFSEKLRGVCCRCGRTRGHQTAP